MKKIMDYILGSKLTIAWDNWSMSGVFGIAMTIHVALFIAHQVLTLIRLFFN
jgi:hypothetical protein